MRSALHTRYWEYVLHDLKRFRASTLNAKRSCIHCPLHAAHRPSPTELSPMQGPDRTPCKLGGALPGFFPYGFFLGASPPDPHLVGLRPPVGRPSASMGPGPCKGAPSGPWMGPPWALHLGPGWALQGRSIWALDGPSKGTPSGPWMGPKYMFRIYKKYNMCFLEK